MKKSKIVIEVCEFLENLKLPASKLAEEAGVSPVLISRIKTGVRKDVTSATADKLREAMQRIKELV